MLASVAIAGQFLNSSNVIARFLADYHQVSTDDNPLGLITADYTNQSGSQVVIRSISTTKGVSTVGLDVGGKAVTKITARPEASVTSQIIKCWHCVLPGSGILRTYNTTESDCLAQNDMLFQDEATRACAVQPQIACYVCNNSTWTIQKTWQTATQCKSQPNQYLLYIVAKLACHGSGYQPLVDCYYCNGNYNQTTTVKCLTTGGKLLKSQCG